MKPLYRYLPLFVALLVLAILSTGIYGATVVRKLFYDRIIVGLEDNALMLKNLILAGSPDSIDSFCKSAGTGYSRVTVIESSGLVLGDSMANPAEMDDHGNRPEIKQAYLGATGNSIRYSHTLKRNMVYLALPAFNLSGRTVVLRTATPFRSLSSELRGAYRQIAVVGAVILVLVSLLGFLLTSRLNGALQIISNAVNEYARGNLAFRPHVYRPPELKRVADTVSNLARDLLQRAAEASRQRDELEAVFAGMEEAVIVLDRNLLIQEMNDAAYQLSDLGAGEGAGKELLLAFRNSRLYEVAEQVRRNKSSLEGEILLFRERERYLQVHASLIPGREEDPRILLVLNDVSRLKKLEQVRQDFVANVAHELRTPITAVRGYVETLLGGDYQDPVTSKDFLQIVLRQVDRLGSIVEDLLIISRLEQKPDPDRELMPCDLNEIVRHVARMYEDRAKSREIRLTVDCPAGQSIPANAVLLEQGIANLVDNAIKHTEAGGRVEITVTPQEKSTMIQVKDNGCGIPEEHLGRIFERFYRVDRGRSRELGGTGLGLSIVKHIAISHGGEVTVRSNEGEGSTFSMILPKVQPDPGA